MSTAYLLVNLGTPEEPTPEKVAPYLKQFLMDPYVVDVPFPIRWFLVNRLIVPKRAHQSASAYKKVWTDQGSPLLVYSKALTQAVAQGLGGQATVRLAMRYGEPSIPSVLDKLKADGITDIKVLPLYPQYALSSTETALQEVRRWVKKNKFKGSIKYRQDFYEDPGFIQATAQLCRREFEESRPHHILFSFHGLPERHIRKVSTKNSYQRQCEETAKALAKEFGLSKNEFTVSYQSRLGRSKWIEPYTDKVLVELAEKGVKSLAVVCPSFVTDCLETLEEIGIRARKDFITAGGEDLCLVPCLNADAAWVECLVNWFGSPSVWARLN